MTHLSSLHLTNIPQLLLGLPRANISAPYSSEITEPVTRYLSCLMSGISYRDNLSTSYLVLICNIG